MQTIKYAVLAGFRLGAKTYSWTLPEEYPLMIQRLISQL
jgi:hypothetical protein